MCKRGQQAVTVATTIRWHRAWAQSCWVSLGFGLGRKKKKCRLQTNTLNYPQRFQWLAPSGAKEVGWNQLSVRFKWANQICSLSVEPLANSLRLYIGAGFHIAVSCDAPQSRSFLFTSWLDSDWPTRTLTSWHLFTITIFKVELLKMLDLKFLIQLSAPPAGRFVVHAPSKITVPFVSGSSTGTHQMSRKERNVEFLRMPPEIPERGTDGSSGGGEQPAAAGATG